jgi:hypothetical protein
MKNTAPQTLAPQNSPLLGFKKAMLAAVCGLGLMASQAPAHAQAYPNKPIKAIVPFAAGSATDQIGRAFAQKTSVHLGSTHRGGKQSRRRACWALMRWPNLPRWLHLADWHQQHQCSAQEPHEETALRPRHSVCAGGCTLAQCH